MQMTRRRNRQTYLEFLVSAIGGTDTYYWRLFECLHSIEWHYLIGMDENREMDARELRDDYDFETGHAADQPFDNYDSVSILEVLTGIIKRLTLSSGLDWGPWRWMYMFIENLGLETYTDDYYSDRPEEFGDFVNLACMIFSDRIYNQDGSGGGLFIVDDRNVDMRRLELFKQWIIFINEQYPREEI